jgi:hypothetical protein
VDHFALPEGTVEHPDPQALAQDGAMNALNMLGAASSDVSVEAVGLEVLW